MYQAYLVSNLALFYFNHYRNTNKIVYITSFLLVKDSIPYVIEFFKKNIQ